MKQSSIHWLILLALFLKPATTVADQNNKETKLKIGVIAPLTGGVATWGLSVRTAMEIANQRSKFPAELLFEDESTCEPRKAVDAYHYLSSIKKVDIIVASCLEGGQAVAPLARQGNMPFFISGRSSVDFQKRNPNALSWISLLDYEGEAIADLILERGWKKASAMVWSGYFGVQFAQGIKTAITNKKVNFSFEKMEIAQGSSPTGAEVQRLIRNTPDAVFLMMSEPAAAYVVKQLKTFRYKGAVVLQSSMLQTYDPKVRKDFIGALQQKFPVDQEQFTNLRRTIKEKLGEDVADDFIFSFDGFSTLLDEAHNCRSSKSQDLNTCLIGSLRNEKWRTGASGRFRFMKDGSTQRPMIFKTIL